MTNIIAAAYLATNLTLTAGDLALTNCNPHLAYERYDCQNACVVERAITCPACGNVSTQRVDITDVHEHYERLRDSDLRLNRSLVAFSIHENSAREEKLIRLQAECDRLRAGAECEVRKACRDMYVNGYTNALMVVVRALRKPAETCTLCRVYTSQEKRLMRTLAAIFENAAKTAGGKPCR